MYSWRGRRKIEWPLAGRGGGGGGGEGFFIKRRCHRESRDLQERDQAGTRVRSGTLSMVAKQKVDSLAPCPSSMSLTPGGAGAQVGVKGHPLSSLSNHPALCFRIFCREKNLALKI